MQPRIRCEDPIQTRREAEGGAPLAEQAETLADGKSPRLVRA